MHRTIYPNHHGRCGSESAPNSSCIRIRGACQNNLKNIDIDIPLNTVTVLTGVSGSGKSSLAFDTIYAEGQRRYIESFSTYARQFMDRMDKPSVRTIDGILPAIAINQTNPVKTSRSTLGTLTEINDYVKLLFPRCAVLHCRQCNRPVRQDTPESVAGLLLDKYRGRNCFICFPFRIPEESAISHTTVYEGLQRQGFFRIFQDGKIHEISPELLISLSGSTIEMLADRTVIDPSGIRRLVDSLETAFTFGSGVVSIFFDGNGTKALKFSASLHCPTCDIHYRRPTPALFSFNTPLGACSNCRGFGRTIEVDYEAVVPDKGLSLKEHAIKPWSTPAYRECYEDMLRFCKQKKIPVDKPFRDLDPSHRDAIFFGDESFYGVRGFFEWLETRTYKMHVRVFLSKYRAYITCKGCNGTRFTDEALLYRLGGKTIAELYAMSISEALLFIRSLKDMDWHDKTVSVLLREIQSRLSYLVRVGLGYLTLDRQSRTLSGGEVERASLTTALGSSLVNTLYVLDEPSIGLHPRDTRMLIDSVRSLRDMGNTVLIVEHDPDIILNSDHVIDLGPRSGEDGGRVVFSGSPEKLLHSSASLTGNYLSGRMCIPIPKQRRQPDPRCWITLQDARAHNLKGLTTRIPLGVLVCITGVSGSGKSTLLEDILYKHLSRKDGGYTCCFFEGSSIPDSVVLMDQSPIGKTPRSNPITYMKGFDAIRLLFARTDLARQRGYTPATFSFNSSGGRCEKCRGEGFEKVQMQFLADVYVQCPACSGTRYTPEVFEVLWEGKNIRQVLDMTVAEALQFFKGCPSVEFPLQILEMVGLGYLRLGQPATTLSGGEAQRLKIASFIRQGARTRTLFLFDEPTTGLHPDDISRLLTTFRFLLDRGHSIIVVEHNMDVVTCADYVIDLGPEGGEDGGYIVVQGTPEDVSRHPSSHTAVFLRKALDGIRAEVRCDDLLHDQNGSDSGYIVITGAREHNLKNISVRIPREQMVVITGVSGSGKSTLAFDILFAEGQRRFLETLSPYVRQYIHQLQRPDVDSIRGLPPSVAIEQTLSRGGKKSTVATATEIYHYLRLLYAKAGQQHCPSCSRPLVSQTPAEIVKDILAVYRGRHCMILSPQVRGRKGFHKEVIRRARQSGYKKVRIDGTIVDVYSIFAVNRYQEHRLEIVIAECNVPQTGRAQIQDAVNRALALGNGEAIALGDGIEKFYSTRAYCPACSLSLPEPDPRLFSFNSSIGACPQCDGMGTVSAPLQQSRRPRKYGTSQDGHILKTETEIVCPACNGTRLVPAARSVLINGKSIADLVRMTPGELLSFVRALAASGYRPEVVRPIVREIIPKLEVLEKAGLSYLTLDRSADTLSGGETQRMRLAAQVASTLRGVTYVLDEPTIGLHPHDNKRLIRIMRELRDKGNTVVIVEHDEETIRSADHIIDLGPAGGTEGGSVVVSGTVQDLMRCPSSATGAALASRFRPRRKLRPLEGCQFLSIFGACEHNLRSLNVHFPIGRLTVVTGVSGSGKTTLVRETLYRAICCHLGTACGTPGAHTSLTGVEAIKRAVEIDQSPIGSTPRSVPATYVGIYDDIRRLFAALPDARMRGFSASRFSFNVSGGRCEKCQGQGTIRVEMNFLPDMYVECDQCRGRRFNEETLQILFRGKDISQVLSMTVEEACNFFDSVPSIRRPLSIMNRMGLGYLKLGQPSPTLSGGEAQRVKIAAELCKSEHGTTLYVLDEPTTGLHMSDVPKLMEVLHELVDHGNTMVIIEHNLDVISQADFVIDLGPGGGDQGGDIVATGTPREIASKKHTQSLTARYLRKYFRDV